MGIHKKVGKGKRWDSARHKGLKRLGEGLILGELFFIFFIMIPKS